MDVTMRMPDLATTDSPMTIVRWLADAGQPVRRGQTPPRGRDRQGRDGGRIGRDRRAPFRDRAGRCQRGRGPGDRDVRGRGTAPARSASTGHRWRRQPCRGSRTQVSDRPMHPLRTSKRPGAGVVLRAEPGRAGAARAGDEHGSESVTLSVARRTLARRMSESQREVPHFYLQTSAQRRAGRRPPCGVGRRGPADRLGRRLCLRRRPGPEAVPPDGLPVRRRPARAPRQRERECRGGPRRRAVHRRRGAARRGDARADLRGDPRRRRAAPRGRLRGPASRRPRASRSRTWGARASSRSRR